MSIGDDVRGLVAKVESEKTVAGGVTVLVDGLQTLLVALKPHVDALGASLLNAIADELRTGSAVIVNAVEANLVQQVDEAPAHQESEPASHEEEEEVQPEEEAEPEHNLAKDNYDPPVKPAPKVALKPKAVAHKKPVHAKRGHR